MSEELEARIGTKLIAHEIDGAAAELESILRLHGEGRFTQLVDLRFTNRPSSVLDELNQFVAASGQARRVKALMLYHNGFLFNNDRWYFEPLAYDTINDVAQNYEWLCSPIARGDECELTGLEAIQQDFEWFVDEDLFENPFWSPIADAAELLVKVRFAQLIETVFAEKQVSPALPIFTNAYHPRFFCRFDP